MSPAETRRAGAPERHGHRFLVAGGGPEAVRLALALADAGVPVTLATRGTLGPAAGGARGSTLADEVPLLVALRSHPAVDVLEGTRELALGAGADGLEARLRVRPQPVDPRRCTSCGKCVPVCPVELPGPRGRAARRAVELPPAELAPAAARIEKEGRAPCRTACPIGVNAQGYVALAARGRFREALALVRDRNPLPGICGRVCTHPCEAACRRGEIDEPVAICRIKRFVADAELAGAEPFAYAGPAHERAERVAIVGSGPAGLTAAFDLRRLGYGVTVFEALDAPGGLLRTGIPEYRLPKAVLDREIGLIAALGVEIRTGVRIGRDSTVDGLLREGFAAVILATGAPRDRGLGVPGEELPGVLGCLAFLRGASLGEGVPVGRRVVVVGGGNSAIDAARAALRLGGKEVTIVYRRGEAEMPALAEEVEAARDEGVRLAFLAAPVAFLGDAGRVATARCVRMRLGEPDASGRRRPEPVAGSEHDLPADTVVLAVGQEGDPGVAAGAAGVEVRGGCFAGDERGRTGNARVFVAGDAARGPDSVIWAMADGQRAALAVHERLSGEAVDWPDWTRTEYDRSSAPRDGFRKAARRRAPHLGMPKRRSSFGEVELAFREKDVLAEAARCLQCAGCCECGACVAACGEARAIDHGTGGTTIALPLLGAARLEPGEEIVEGAGHLVHDGAVAQGSAQELAKGILARLGADLPAAALLSRPPATPPSPAAAPSAAVFLCTCNGSVLRRELVDTLAGELASLAGVASVRVVNAACQAEGAAAMAAATAGGADRVLLAACLCCTLGVVCSSCTHQRARCKENLLGGGRLHPGAFEAVNLRDEVLNQPALDPADAQRLGRRVLLGGLARALAAPPPRAAVAANGPQAAAGPDRPAPVPLRGVEAATAHVDADLCRGCGTCVRECPQEAIALVVRTAEPGAGLLPPDARPVPLARVDPGRCTLCGTCIAVCPSGAPDAPFEGHAQLRAALAAALAGGRD